MPETQPANGSRKIIHVDMDCFYAAIEMREQPSLKGKPIAVGGQPGTRSVVATCSYEARKFGVHSAMPMTTAKKLCPDLIIVPVNMALYKQVSNEIHRIFREYTAIVEPLSLDEAYLDVTQSRHCQGSATLIARQIRERIFTSQHITASAGIAPNKFLAKVASEANKPDGQFVIIPDKVSEFVRTLPVKRIFGVGKVTARRMQELNIETCGDLQKLGIKELQQHFGSFGQRLYEYSRGIDDRPVKTTHIRKSLSVEDTFAEDLPSLEACLLEIPRLYDEMLRRLAAAQGKQVLVPKSLFVKMRFNDFTTTTVQQAMRQPVGGLEKRGFYALCAQGWERGRRPVRLLGIGLQFHPPEYPEQLSLF